MRYRESENLETLQVLLQQNPDSLTFARVADALNRRGRLDEAIQVCEEGVKRHPSYVTGHLVLGKCYLQKKLYDQAEKEFKRVLLFDPKYLAAHQCLAELMREMGWDNTSEMSYRKILNFDPLDDKVKAILEDFARKADTADPEDLEAADNTPAFKAPEANIPLTTVPISDDDLLAMTSTPEVPDIDFHAIAETRPFETTEIFKPEGDFSEPEFDSESEPESSEQAAGNDTEALQLSDAEQEKFSSILDDIFNDEGVDLAPGQSAAQPPSEGESIADDDEIEEPPPVQPKPSQLVRRSATRPPTRPGSHPIDLDMNFDDDEPEEPQTVAVARVPAPTAAPPPRPEQPAAPPPQRPQTLSRRILSSSSPRDRIVTPTLGEIYAAQGQYAKAIGVFELLSRKDPNNRKFREKIDYLKKRLQETQNAG